jgi:hypothetical protein
MCHLFVSLEKDVEVLLPSNRYAESDVPGIAVRLRSVALMSKRIASPFRSTSMV